MAALLTLFGAFSSQAQFPSLAGESPIHSGLYVRIPDGCGQGRPARWPMDIPGDGRYIEYRTEKQLLAHSCLWRGQRRSHERASLLQALNQGWASKMLITSTSNI